MCDFFSCVSDGKNKVLYADNELRKSNKIDSDSHSELMAHFGINGVMSDRWNKYEYNPLTKKFTVDKINTDDDSEKVEKFCNNLDFSTIVPELIIKPIIHPFKDVKCGRITKKDIENLAKWASVLASVGNSVWNSVGNSVWSSVGNSIWHSVRDLVWNSVRDSVWNSVWDSVGNSVWNSVGNSVWDSVYGYVSSFFNIDKWKFVEHEKGKNPFQCCIDLWERGIAPSFDGKIWRLHTYKGIVKEFTVKELKEIKAF